jgi:SIR2-like protein
MTPFAINDVCFLLGAGASVPAGLPTMPRMGLDFFEKFSLPDLRGFLDSMDIEMPRHDPHWSPNDRNVESLLRALQEKSESARNSKLMPFAPGSIDPRVLAHQVEARSSTIVAHELKKFILAQLTKPVRTAYLAPLREWLGGHQPLDIFSLNYDTVVEQFCKSGGIPCTDGFNQAGEWHPDLYHRANSGVRLWKLHGSVNWTSSESGWPHQAETPGSWRRHFYSRHTASATAEAALVWPAATKRLEKALTLLHSAFRNRLSTCRLLVVAGYRFADEHIRAAVIDNLQINPLLHVLILCGSPSTSDAAKSALLLGSSGYESNVEVFEPGRIEEALGRGSLRLKATELLQHPNSGFSATATFPPTDKPEVLCLGSFSAIDKAGDNLILSSGNPQTSVASFDPLTRRLRPICSWRGWARGLTVLGNNVIIADCARAGFKAGWGISWKIDPVTGKRDSLLSSSSLGFVKAMLRTARYRSGVGAAVEFLDYGMLSWPTFADAVTSQNIVLITEARRLVMIDLNLRTARALTEPRFFNLAAVRHVEGKRCILLEHVLQQEGVLWEIDYGHQTATPILAGISNATGLLLNSTKELAFVAQGDDAPNGKIWQVNLTTKFSSLFANNLDRPGAMVALDDDHIAVATARALVKIALHRTA